MHRAQTKAARWRALMLGTVCTLLVASPVQALTPNEIEHIANRLGFGARPEDRIALAPLNREQAVSYFLRGADKGCEAVTVPRWAEAMSEPQIKADEAAQKAFKRQRHAHKVELQAWWLNAIVSSPAPLCERMAMFWHEYFPIQVSQTRSEIPIVRQIQRFRRQWAGDFGDVLKEMSRDAAMMEYLQLQYSHRRHPNENYAREFLELYTLGPGHYSEVDVREAARAYTGWRNVRRIDQFLFWWPAHDFGEKTFLGQTGRWDGDDIVDIVLAQPRTAEYVVEKFWHAFISPTPDPLEVRRLAAVLRHHWQIRTLLKAMFRSPAFWADANRNTLVKTPIDLVVGSLRQAGATQVNGNAAAAWTMAMGQGVYFPPDVKGWRGHTQWLTVQTLQTRLGFLSGLAQGFDDGMVAAVVEQVPEFPGFDPQTLLKDSMQRSTVWQKGAAPPLRAQVMQLEYQLK